MSYAGIITDKNNTDHPIGSTLYGACSTAADVAAKVVTCADVDVLEAGMMIPVAFAYGNTAANPTININDTGAKDVYAFGGTRPVGDDSWADGAVVVLVYDGTNYTMASQTDVGAVYDTINAIKDGTDIDSFADVETALATKQDTLTFDPTPTEDSANPVTSGGVYDALGDKANQSEVDDITENTESETATLSGNPLTLTDALATDAISVVAEIEPEQDLHGYGKPWSGGSGKNKLPLVLADLKTVNTAGTWSGNSYTINDVTFTVNTDSDGNVTGITANGTATNGNADFDLTSNASIAEASQGLLYSGCPSGSATTYGLCRLSAGIIQYGGNDVAWPTTVSNVSTYIRVIDGATCNNVIFTPMLRLATETDATFEPYTNICPISGMDSVTVTTTDGTDTNTATASLGTTIYGGSVDMTEGSGSVAYKTVNLYDLPWGKSGTSFYSANITDMWLDERTENISYGYGLSNSYAFVTSSADTLPAGITLFYSYVYSGYRCFIHDVAAEDMTVDEFKQRLTDIGAKVCYKLATPTTLSLTPTTLAMLEGENTVSTDAEEVSVEYVKNTLAGRVKHLEDESGSGVIDYSTTEQKTGQKWIDGKDIYTITVVLQSAITINQGQWGATSLSAADIDTITSVSAKSGKFVFGGIGAAIADGYVNLMNNSASSMSIDTFTIWYTKTT